MKMFFPPKSLIHIVYHPFQMMNNINKCTISIQDIRNNFKGRPLGMNRLKRLNLEGQIQNEIGFAYLGHLGVGLI
jgi:hypothetical protein